jgi:hypothetical protein
MIVLKFTQARVSALFDKIVEAIRLPLRLRLRASIASFD